MNRAQISEMIGQTERLQELTEQFYELMTSEAGRQWKGDAYQACCEESRDNREQARLAINECRKIIDMRKENTPETGGLPADFLQ